MKYTITFNNSHSIDITPHKGVALWQSVQYICEACNKDTATTTVTLNGITYNAETVISLQM